jgi:hypothetical protein
MKQKNPDKFNFFVPVQFEKAKKGEKGVVRVKGIASTSSAVDSDGETLFPDGFDVEPLLKKGFLNWDHQTKSRPLSIVGEPEKAEVINNGRDLYIEGFLYPDSKDAQEVAELAQILEKNSKTRRLGYSIEGQVLQRGSNDKNHPLYKQVLKARITGIAITPQPKNPNTLLSLVKGEYNDLFVDEEELTEEETADLEKGGAGSGRHKKGDTVKYKKEADKSVYRSGEFTVHKFLSSDNPDKEGYELKDKEGNSHKAQHTNLVKIEKSFTAEGASAAGLIPEHVEGVKQKKDTVLDGGEGSSVGRLVKKSEIYNLIFEKYTTDIEKAKQIYGLVEQTNEKVFNMAKTEITKEAVDKAFEFLNKAGAAEGDTLNKSEESGAITDIEKAKEMCKGFITEGLTKGTVEKSAIVEALVKGGVGKDLAELACSSCVSEMSNLTENGGVISQVSPSNGNTGKDQSLNKGELQTLFAEAFGPTNELIKSLADGTVQRFNAVGKILEHTVAENEVLKGQLDELGKRLEKVEKTPLPAKSMRTVKSTDRFAKSEGEEKYGGLPEDANVYDLKNKEDREAVLDIVDAEIEKSRQSGRKPSAVLQQIVAEIETVGQVTKPCLATLAGLKVFIN